MAMRISSPFLQFQEFNRFTTRNLPKYVLTNRTTTTCSAKQILCGRSLNITLGGLRSFPKPICAVGSGLEASISETKDNAITVKNAKIVVESQNDEEIQLRVDVPGEDTQIVFDKVLTNLAKTAPPVPGFRRQKGGKTSKVPKSFLLQIIGEDRVTKFVIQELVNSTLADYVTKENLTVKDNKISTTQSAEELKLLFNPGKEFGFNAIVEIEKAESEITASTSSEI